MEKGGKRLSRRDFLKLGLIVTLALSGCEPIVSNITATPKPGDTPTTETTPLPDYPTDLPTDVPAGGDITPEAPIGRSIISPEMVRNVEPSLEIGSGQPDDHNNILPTVYPENASDIVKGAIDRSYASIERQFPGSHVFFNQDTAPGGSGQWILYAIDENGDLIHEIYSYSESGAPGSEQYFDYPFSYDGLGNVRGDYVTIPFEGELGVIWTGSGASRLPQFVSNKRAGTDGDNYFTMAFKYDTLYPDDPWVEVSGVDELLAPATPENPGYFEGVGEIVEIEQHEGSWYGIDTVGRAEIVFNGSEWVKFDRPIFGADFENYGGDVMDLYDLRYNFDIDDLNLDEVPASEIKTLTNTGGTLINWGFQIGSTHWIIRHGTGPDTTFTSGDSDDLPVDVYNWHSQFSGYFIGKIAGDAIYTNKSDGSVFTELANNYYVFEIPYRYGRQIILISEPKVTDGSRFVVSFGDVVGADNVRSYFMGDLEIIQFLHSNLEDLRGQQCIIDFHFSQLSDPNLWPTLRENQPYNSHMPILFSQYFFFSSIFDKK